MPPIVPIVLTGRTTKQGRALPFFGPQGSMWKMIKKAPGRDPDFLDARNTRNSRNSPRRDPRGVPEGLQLISRARALDRSSGRPLRTVFRTWRDSTVEIRRGQVHLFASGPGVGKSALGLTVAVRSDASCVYLSADSDVSTQYARLGAMITGDEMSTVMRAIETRNTEKYDQVLNDLTRLRFEFDASPTLQTMEECVQVWADIHGRWPELIILDNLQNAVDESGGEGFQALENILAFLHELARETKAAVIVLHHLVGIWEDGTEPAPLSGLRGKVSKIPELIINLFRWSDPDGFQSERLGCSVVKNRGGKASAAGKMVLLLNLDLERMNISDLEEEVNYWEEQVA